MTQGGDTQRAADTQRAGDPQRAAGGRGRSSLGWVAAGATLLATAPLSVVFAHWTWLWQCAAAVGAVAAGAAAARARRAPVWAQTLAMVGALLLALTWLHRSGDELLQVLPGPATFGHFETLLAQTPQLVAEQVVPVGDQDSLLFVTALGVGLTAVMVDLVSVSGRRPALAGLPMLALYSVPVAVETDGVHAFTFAVGALGYLWLLAADRMDRVRRFGHRFTGDGRTVAAWEASPLAAAGRRLAVVAAALAVALPLAVPGVGSGVVERFGGGSGAGGPGSGGSGTSVNLFAHLDGLLNRDTTEELLRVQTTDPDPFYLRVGVADQISEEGFGHRSPDGDLLRDTEPGEVSLSAAGTGVDRQRYKAEIEVVDWEMDRLPVYSGLVSLTGVDDDEWSYDPGQEVVFSDGVSASGADYRFEFERLRYDPEALRATEPLPESDDIRRDFAETIAEPQVDSLVSTLTQGEDNPYDRIRALLEHFSRDNGFEYSLETGPATTGSAIRDFLFEHQAGYCVQYAAALAWMARSADMPSRVAIGFTRGSAQDGVYTLTNHNLHAWTEVYFDGFGWIPFDATPSDAIDGSARPDWSPDPDTREDDDPDTASPDQQDSPGSASPGPSAAPGPTFAPGGGEVGGGPAGGDDRTGAWLAAVLAVALLACLAAAPAARRMWLRRRRTATSRIAGSVAGTPDTGAPDTGALAGPPAGSVAAAAGTVGSGTAVTGDAAASARYAAHAAWQEVQDTLVDLDIPVPTAATLRGTVRAVREWCGGQSRSPDQPPTRALDVLADAEERARYAPQPAPAAGSHQESPGGFGSLAEALHAVTRTLPAAAPARRRWRALLLPPSVLRRWRAAASDAAVTVTTAGTRVGEALAAWSPRRLLRQEGSPR